MAEKDFQVKNGLVVNSNNYGGANRLVVNSSALWFGNSTANVIINSVAINIGGLSFSSASYPGKAALAGFADNTAFVGSITAANVVSNAQLQANLANYSTTATITSTYQTMAGLSANVLTLTSANSTRLNAKLEANLNVNSALTANYATYAGRAAWVGNNGSSTGSQITFTHAPQLGMPTYVWGTTDGVIYRPYNPSVFNSATATTATNLSGGDVAAVNMSFNQGYGSIAIAYGVRAWCVYYGNINVLSRAGNISSVTRSSAGVYTFNFSTPMPDASYAIAVGTGDISGVGNEHHVIDTVRTTSFRVLTSLFNDSWGDNNLINVVVVR